MRISDWSSDVCSSDLVGHMGADRRYLGVHDERDLFVGSADSGPAQAFETARTEVWHRLIDCYRVAMEPPRFGKGLAGDPRRGPAIGGAWRSEEHTSELQSLMRISYAVFCLKKKRQ